MVLRPGHGKKVSSLISPSLQQKRHISLHLREQRSLARFQYGNKSKRMVASGTLASRVTLKPRVNLVASKQRLAPPFTL